MTLLAISLMLLQADGVTLHATQKPCAVDYRPIPAPKRENLQALAEREARALGAQIELFEVRPARRALNILTLVAGSPMVDPGHYRLELRLNDGAAHASIEFTPTVKGLFFGNGFSRESVMRGRLRRQINELRAQLRTTCPP